MPDLTLPDLNDRIERQGDRIDEIRLQLLYRLVTIGVAAIVILAPVAGGAVFKWYTLLARVTEIERTLEHNEEHEVAPPKAKWWNPVG